MRDAELIARLRDAAGPEGVAADGEPAAFAADGRVPACVASPPDPAALERCVAAAAAVDAAILPAGSGARLGVGRPPTRYDVAVSTRRLRAIEAHDAADLTVTVQAGVTLGALDAALAAAGQWLPLDPPDPARATVGAVIATDATGPLRLACGKVRDHVLGLTVVLADGTRVRGGGRVVKNVAGYDLVRLFTGSHGTLGIIAAATLRVAPRPPHAAALLVRAASAPEAIGRACDLLEAAVAPLWVAVLDAGAAARIGLPAAATVAVGLGGSRPEIAVQRDRLQARAGAPGTLADAEPAALHAAIRDLPAGTACAATVSLVPSDLAAFVHEATAAGGVAPPAVLALPGNGIARLCWFELPPDAAGFAAEAARLRRLARSRDGWLVFDTLPGPWKAAIDPWGPEAPGLALMRRIKRALDPDGRLAPGRFVDGI